MTELEMLTVTGFDDSAGEPVIEYDNYVPVTVTWPRYRDSLDVPLSVGLHGTGGYLELNFDPSSGGLEKLVLVSAITAVRNEELPAAVFSRRQTGGPIITLPTTDRSVRALSADFPFPQTAYNNGLEIRLADEVPVSIFAGSMTAFGLSESSRLAVIYIGWTAVQRALFIESSGIS